MAELLAWISAHGLAVVISAGVLLILNRIAGILTRYLERRLGVDPEHEQLTDLRRRVDTTVVRIIEQAVLRARASRVYIVEFHNGTVALGGLPFLKMTCTYEALGDGAPSERYRRDNVTLHSYSTLINSLMSNDYIVPGRKHLLFISSIRALAKQTSAYF